MPRYSLGLNVYDAAMARLTELYAGGHRVVVMFSAGKDSGVCVELCVLAARATGRLPVDVVMRDEEIMYPGTYEYAERVAARPEIRFVWATARQPVLNVFNRAEPYFWVFDPQLPPERWVRQPPAYVTEIKDLNIVQLITTTTHPPEPGKHLYKIIGLRASESRRRTMAIANSGGHISRSDDHDGGSLKSYPIYDWQDGDVYRAINEFGWDYNHAYDTMAKMGLPARQLRIAPPTLNQAAIISLQVASKAWPAWFDRVCERLPGVRTAAQFGRRACSPTRRLGETWRECYFRECVAEAPSWIALRAQKVATFYERSHDRHATTPFPEVMGCEHCEGSRTVASWRNLAAIMWNGDPWLLRIWKGVRLGYVEPEFFRPGSGRWGGMPG